MVLPFLPVMDKSSSWQCRRQCEVRWITSKLWKSNLSIRKSCYDKSKTDFYWLSEARKNMKLTKLLNNILLGEVGAFHFIAPCGTQKFLGQDIRTGQTPRLADFLRWWLVSEMQNSMPQRKSCTTHKVFCCCSHNWWGTCSGPQSPVIPEEWWLSFIRPGTVEIYLCISLCQTLFTFHLN